MGCQGWYEPGPKFARNKREEEEGMVRLKLSLPACCAHVLLYL